MVINFYCIEEAPERMVMLELGSQPAVVASYFVARVGESLVLWFLWTQGRSHVHGTLYMAPSDFPLVGLGDVLVLR